MRAIVEVEERPVVEPMPLEYVQGRGRERCAEAAAVEVGDVWAGEAALRDLLGDGDGVAVVDALPCEGVEEEVVAEEELLLDLDVGLKVQGEPAWSCIQSNSPIDLRFSFLR